MAPKLLIVPKRLNFVSSKVSSDLISAMQELSIPEESCKTACIIQKTKKIKDLVFLDNLTNFDEILC